MIKTTAARKPARVIIVPDLQQGLLNLINNRSIVTASGKIHPTARKIMNVG